VGCQVNQLKRIRFGPVSLPQSLPPGRWLDLDPNKIRDEGAAD
jgi:16S rRNA U516 pseudouridylate synthase RsuA-like enzyme